MSDESRNEAGVRLAEFLKSIPEWPQPEAWYDHDEGCFKVDWSRDQNYFATVFFYENRCTVKWTICNHGQFESGEKLEIPAEVLHKIRAVAEDV